MQIGQQTWYITNIQALDAATDRLSLSQSMPGGTAPMPVFGMLTQDVPKPHTHTTGDAILVTLETTP